MAMSYWIENGGGGGMTGWLVGKRRIGKGGNILLHWDLSEKPIASDRVTRLGYGSVRYFILYTHLRCALRTGSDVFVLGYDSLLSLILEWK